ncbi:hypothetical protein [Novipirellula artificiosorum]|nr:hypothetical protein [Novipirellula artificiosorum]
MTNSQRLAMVRNRLRRWVAEQHGGSTEENSTSGIVSESMLIREGFFCGRSFELTDHRAIWFIEEDQLKIYSDAGNLECVFTGSEIDTVNKDHDEHSVIRMHSPTTLGPSAADQDLRRAA